MDSRALFLCVNDLLEMVLILELYTSFVSFWMVGVVTGFEDPTSPVEVILLTHIYHQKNTFSSIYDKSS